MVLIRGSEAGSNIVQRANLVRLSRGLFGSKNPLLAVMSGWKFEEVKDGENDAYLIGLIAKNDE